MKIVLDSNVIIAAFTSRGLCNSIFELCIEKYKITISTYILDEVSNILGKKFNIPQNKISEILFYLKEFCTLENYKKIDEQISRDNDDDEIISLALDNSVNYIITGDKDLLILKKYKSIKFVTPREFWEIAKKDKNI